MSRYTYTHEDCGQTVTKKPVGRKKIDTKKKKADEPTLEWIGLHGWKCPVHGSGIKVHRVLNGEQK